MVPFPIGKIQGFRLFHHIGQGFKAVSAQNRIIEGIVRQSQKRSASWNASNGKGGFCSEPGKNEP